jgi:hypothetical protein
VIVIAKVQATLLERHQGCIRISGAGFEVGPTPIAVSDDGPIGSTGAGQPVVTLLIGTCEQLAFGLGDRNRQLDRLTCTCFTV